ncbi:unnamed protein product [Paramecium pentaurelia]|uniref:Ubiquitin carboxyl-terminal hydrolase 47 n=1 Tax=Paramecium pentaurelia TaxID=43138 RepID=A0A8S1W4K5_9CILI|nr:unnamed protein product [Paramecium pentaurelia]
MTTNSYQIDAPYLGLQNIGATCYMNSVLQTLFMTPEFRRGLYLWKYEHSIHGEEIDSIPFQLQKLYGRLQTKIFEYIDTRDLTKSFQWDIHQAFQQHDIQEFIRILFDAIEQSDQNCNFVKELYEGAYLHYTKCLKCNYESQRQEIFMDYTVILKDKWSKVYNNSLELAIQRSLKPEKLEGNNQYFCESCQAKQDAHRGQLIYKLPSILNVHINRFAFDYIMMRREKLDDKMAFPFVLNMNNYNKTYDDIPNKISEDTDPQYFEELVQPKKQQFKATSTNKVQSTSHTTKTTKVTRPNQGLKDFIKQQKKVAKQQGDVIDTFGTMQEDEQIQQIIHQQIQEDIKQSQQQTNNNENKTNIPPPPPLPIFDHDLEYQDISKVQSNNQIQESQIQDDKQKKNKDEDKDKLQQQPILDTTEERKKYIELVKKKCQDSILEQDNQIRQYLKDGPNVYQLYSILNHSGGAMGGHYFAYIRSHEDGQWYCFNDSSVTYINPDDIPVKTFGGHSGGSAYMLFYRKVEPNQESWGTWGGQFQENELPEYVQLKLQEERINLEEYKKQGGQTEDLFALQKPITIKAHYKLEVKTFTLENNTSFLNFRQLVLDHFQIKDRDNCRIRIYNPYTDQFQDTFEGKEMRSLAALKLQNKCVSIEFKQQNEEWKPYNEQAITFRVALYKENLEALDEKTLQPKKVTINKNDFVHELVEQSKKEYKLEGEYQILKRNGEFGEILSLDKPIEGYYENSFFYLEPKTENSNWLKEFEIDEHRITIKFNDPTKTVQVSIQEGQPEDLYPLVCTIDNRATMMELKERICQQIGISHKNLILRRGGRAGLELKDMTIEVGLNHFVRGSSIHLDIGTPLHLGEYRCIISIASAPNLYEDRNFYQFQELGEYSIPGDKPISQFINDLAIWASEKSGIQLDSKHIRLRERIADRLNKVYRDKPLKEQGIVEMRMIAIEQLQDEWQHLTSKDVFIHARFWDQEKWDLSERFEFVVSRNQSGADLADQFTQVFGIQAENIEVCRIVAVHRFNRYELLNEEWIPLKNDDYLLGSQPLFITNDGQLIILRDSTQQPRELTNEEIKQFGIIQSNYTKSIKTGVSRGPVKTRFFNEEKALVITVKKKAEEIKPEV